MTDCSPLKPRLLFVDDEADILSSLRRYTRGFGWDCEFAQSGDAALAVLEDREFDVVVCDMRMPGMSGATFLRRCREHYPDMVRILLTGYSDMDALMEAINAARIHNYITKPWDDSMLGELIEGAIRYRGVIRENQQLQRRTKEQNALLTELNGALEQQVEQRTSELRAALRTIESHNSQLEENLDNIVAVLANLVEHKEGKRGSHSRSVSELCVAIGERMELKPTHIADIRIAGMLHDIGMLGLSDNIRNKPLNRLTGKELTEYKKHPIIAEATLAGIGGMESTAEIVRMHHEKLDGSGFPEGLNGRQIPLGAKILSAASDYHDLLHGHHHDSIHGCDAALDYLQLKAAEQYDQNVIAALLAVVAENKDQASGSMTVECEELTPEMRLAADLVSDSGLLLLSKGSMPSDTVIKRLTEYQRQANTRLKIVVEVEGELTFDELPEPLLVNT